MKDHFKNISTVVKYFINKYQPDSPVINGDQVPLHRNESASQKALSLKSEKVFEKENHMLSRERVTCFTQLCSDPNWNLNWNQHLRSKVKVHEHTSLLQKVYIINGLQKHLTELKWF